MRTTSVGTKTCVSYSENYSVCVQYVNMKTSDQCKWQRTRLETVCPPNWVTPSRIPFVMWGHYGTL